MKIEKGVDALDFFVIFHELFFLDVGGVSPALLTRLFCRFCKMATMLNDAKSITAILCEKQQ